MATRPAGKGAVTGQTRRGMFHQLKTGPAGLYWRAWRYRDMEIARMIQRNLRTIETEVHPKNGGLELPRFGIVLDPKRHEDILRAIPVLLALQRNANATFAIPKERLLEVNIRGLTLTTEVIQNIEIIDEVFAKQIYQLECPRDAFVWDVGGNVGFSAVYFASKGWNVRCYEPFPQNAELAKVNIERNNLTDRIEWIVAGLAAKPRTETLVYHKQRSGSDGLFGNPQSDPGPGEPTPVTLLDPVEEFKTALKQAGGRILVAKIDCEGAEYEILRALRSQGLLEKIGVLMIEIHELPHEDFAEPKRFLQEAGMLITKEEAPGPDLRILTAVGAHWSKQ